MNFKETLTAVNKFARENYLNMLEYMVAAEVDNECEYLNLSDDDFEKVCDAVFNFYLKCDTLTSLENVTQATRECYELGEELTSGNISNHLRY